MNFLLPIHIWSIYRLLMEGGGGAEAQERAGEEDAEGENEGNTKHEKKVGDQSADARGRRKSQEGSDKGSTSEKAKSPKYERRSTVRRR